MELVVIFVVILILFGGKRLPEIARAVGSAVREFRATINSATTEFDISSAVNKAHTADTKGSEEKKAEGMEAGKEPEAKSGEGSKESEEKTPLEGSDGEK